MSCISCIHVVNLKRIGGNFPGGLAVTCKNWLLEYWIKAGRLSYRRILDWIRNNYKTNISDELSAICS